MDSYVSFFSLAVPEYRPGQPTESSTAGKAAAHCQVQSPRQL